MLLSFFRKQIEIEFSANGDKKRIYQFFVLLCFALFLRAGLELTMQIKLALNLSLPLNLWQDPPASTSQPLGLQHVPHHARLDL